MDESKHAELFKALSVETRIRIIELLKEKGPQGVKELAEILGITPSAVSQHLKVLKYAGLVHSERKGYWLPYEIDGVALENCGEMLSDVCRCGCKVVEGGEPGPGAMLLLALLGLPVAKRIAPELQQIDKQLASILADVTDVETNRSERDLLGQLIKIEAQLETYRADTTLRFSATRAYHQLVKDRLERISEKKVDEHLSINEFINRRFIPALRTCESIQQLLEDLSKRIERASDLMRTRVNLNLQEQNRSQLIAMNRRSRLQFRLQETVEGLSIAAISYYAVGLLSYLLVGLPLDDWGLEKNSLLAGSIPVVLLTIWFLTRRIKRHLIHNQEAD